MGGAYHLINELEMVKSCVPEADYGNASITGAALLRPAPMARS